MNKTFVAVRPIPRRGRVYQPGEEVEIAHSLHNWRRNQISAGNLREAPSSEKLDIAKMTVSAISTYVAEIDDVAELRALAEGEQEGRGRVTAVDAIMARIDALITGEHEDEEFDEEFDEDSDEDEDSDTPEPGA